MSSRGHRGSISYNAPNPNAPVDFSLPILFEVAWEVANKVGGIYTVIKTKVPFTVAEFGERYCLIGPYSHSKAQVEVEPIPNPPSAPFRQTIETMRAAGVNVIYGKWLVEGSPSVLLFDLGSARKWLGDWKTDLWLSSRIPSPPDDFETDEAVIFGYLVQWFLGEYVNRLKTAEHNVASDLWLTPPAHHHTLPMDPENPSLIAQHNVYSVFQKTGESKKGQPLVIAMFHEWLVGVGLVLVEKKNIDVATVFITHATLLGRYLCAGAEDFYNNVPFFDCDNEAGRRQIYQRYCIERGAAHAATVFATVSGITGYEAEHLLKRKPDGIVPNGLNVKKFQAMHEFQNLHARNKEKIHEFVRAHWYGHYDFDLDNTLYFFTAGRLEHRNKGLDMYIEALARLNARLKNMGSPITVVAFIITSAPTRGFGVEALKGQAVMKQLKDTVEQISRDVGKRILEQAARRTMPDPNDLLTDDDLVLLKRRIFALKRDTMPPIVTHNMAEDGKDPVLNQLRQCLLFNWPADRVKVIYHPEFLNSNNPVLPIDYDDFVRGTHLGVFPSYYEPWGYTPAECTVMGVPSITSNLSGFGNYMEELVSHPADYGIYIVDRRFKSPEESVEQLVSYMLEFCQKTRRQRINQRNRTERLSYLLDWKRMGIQYQKMRWLAVRRKWVGAIPEDMLAEEEDSGMFRSKEDEGDDGLSVSGVDAMSEGMPVEDDEGVEGDLREMATPRLDSFPDGLDETVQGMQGLGISSEEAAKAPADKLVQELQRDLVEDDKEMTAELVAVIDRAPSPAPRPASPAPLTATEVPLAVEIPAAAASNTTSAKPAAASSAPKAASPKPAAGVLKPAVANGHGKK